jgi:hypothetical protein
MSLSAIQEHKERPWYGSIIFILKSFHGSTLTSLLCQASAASAYTMITSSGKTFNRNMMALTSEIKIGEHLQKVQEAQDTAFTEKRLIVFCVFCVCLGN